MKGAKGETKAQLQRELSALRRRVARMERPARARKGAGQGKAKAERDLRERVKELTCLYGLQRLGKRCGNSLDRLLQGIAELLPPSWQYPEVACARVILNGKRYATAGLRRTRWKQAADIKLDGGKVGAVEVYYRRKMPDSDEGPFLKEERTLIDAIAERTGCILEHLRAEEALRKSENMLRLVLDTIPAFVFWKDRDSVYLGCNRNFSQAIGLGEPENVVGKTDYDIFPDKELAEFYRGWDRRVMEADTPVLHLIEKSYRAPSAGDLWAETNKVPLHDEEGNVTGILGTYEDITDRKRAEEEIRRANRELQVEHTALEEANTALRTVLSRIEDEKAAIREDILANVDKVLMPILHAMEAEAPPEQKGYVSLLRRNLEEMTSPFVGRLTKAHLSLTPAETQVCNMIRSGLTSKEIAQLRHVSPVTVSGQRERIRRKLGIANKKVNLVTYLHAFESGQDRLGTGGQGSALRT